jgi:hypothetical protein
MDTPIKPYDGIKDAEDIMKNVMKRSNYGFEVIESLSAKLVEINRRETDKEIKRRSKAWGRKP